MELASHCIDNNDDLKRQYMPLVSILVVAYNHEKFIRECLNSLLYSDYSPLEILIVNDASTDNTDGVIREWLEKQAQSPVRIQYINHVENTGLTKSMNEAISVSHGDFICYISSDDVMLRHGISARVNYLLNNPDKLAVYADCHVIDENSQIFELSGIEGFYKRSGARKRFLNIPELVPYNVVFNWGVPGPVFMCRRETFDIVGYYDEELPIEDWDMYLRIAALGKLGFCDAVVSSWRVHRSNTIFSLRKGGSLDRWMELTIEKNIHRFRGINRLRLLAMQKRYIYKRLKQPWIYYFKAKALYYLSRLLYHLRVLQVVVTGK